MPARPKRHSRLADRRFHGDIYKPPAWDGKFRVRSRHIVDLGGLRICFQSNIPDFKEMTHFRQNGVSADSEYHYTVNCVDLSRDGPWDIGDIEWAVDRTYRGRRFANGYYLNDHFGAPAYLVGRDRSIWIYGEEFAPIVWPYVVKRLLTQYAIEEDLLHLKGSAFTLGDQAILLVARGHGGKTTFLARLCSLEGVGFLSNTHILLKENLIQPLPTAIRVRIGTFSTTGNAIDDNGGAGRREVTYLSDPIAEQGWRLSSPAPCRTICLLNFITDPKARTIHEIDSDTLYTYMEGFSSAMNVYGLREDVLDYLGRDVGRYAAECDRVSERMRSLIDGCRRLYISCDIFEDRNRQAVLQALDC